MTPAENLVPGKECGPSSVDDGSVNQPHGGGTKTVGAADAAYKAIRKITCLGSGFVGGELTQPP